MLTRYIRIQEHSEWAKELASLPPVTNWQRPNKLWLSSVAATPSFACKTNPPQLFGGRASFLFIAFIILGEKRTRIVRKILGSRETGEPPVVAREDKYDVHTCLRSKCQARVPTGVRVGANFLLRIWRVNSC